MIKFDIRNRFTGKVQFTAEIEAEEGTRLSIKVGLAVRWALKFDVDLRGAYLGGANLRGADLRSADLRGAYLRDANLRDAYLRDANLRDADLRDANLRDADLRSADLRGANLEDANLRDANLEGANLEGANLGGANLRGAKFGEAPKIDNIHSAVLAAATKHPDALDMSDWHCGTSHCRAGWVTTLAGGAGADLEGRIGTAAAATAIYAVSDPDYIPRDGMPDFYCSNDDALADMKRLAEMEGQS